jgi:hypothetical protein
MNFELIIMVILIISADHDITLTYAMIQVVRCAIILYQYSASPVIIRGPPHDSDLRMGHTPLTLRVQLINIHEHCYGPFCKLKT